MNKTAKQFNNKNGGAVMNRYNQKKRRSKKEQIGFYTALSICIIAIAMAAYSTYTNLSGFLQDDDSVAQVNQVVTGVSETETTTEVTTTTETTSETTVETTSEFVEETGESQDALQTMLTVNTSLSYPLDNASVLKEYSEETVYNKTLNQWEAHTGVDFKCDIGDNVYSMGDGEVVKVYNDDMLGNTVVVKSATYTVYYSGLGEDITLSKGSAVKTGDVLGVSGVVPCEVMEENHIHIAVKVDGNYIDPLTLINNEE